VFCNIRQTSKPIVEEVLTKEQKMPSNDCRFLVFGLLLAAPMITFGDSASTLWTIGAGGSYTWSGDTSGGNTAVHGSGIAVQSVQGIGTTSNNNVSKDITGLAFNSAGSLSFTSGSYAGFNSLDSSYNWNGGGTLMVYGCIKDVTIGCDPSSPSVALIHDDFQTLKIIDTGGGLHAVFGDITGYLDQSLLGFYGLSNPVFAIPQFTADISSASPIAPGVPFSGSGIDGNISLVQGQVTVSEYWDIFSTLSLFAFALAALGVARRLGLRLVAL